MNMFHRTLTLCGALQCATRFRQWGEQKLDQAMRPKAVDIFVGPQPATSQILILSLVNRLKETLMLLLVVLGRGA
jgi:hypothetical protein